MASIPVGFYLAHLLYLPVGGTRVASFGIGLNWTGVGVDPPPDEVAGLVYDGAVLSSSIGTSSFIGTDWTFLGVDVSYEQEVGPISGSHLDTVAGSGSANQIPVNGAILVNKNTLLGGRRNRGRLFFPPVYPGEGLIDALGVLAGAAVTNLQGRFDYWHDQLISADLEPVLFHSEAPFTPTPIFSFTVQNLLGTQRRRMRK